MTAGQEVDTVMKKGTLFVVALLALWFVWQGSRLITKASDAANRRRLQIESVRP